MRGEPFRGRTLHLHEVDITAMLTDDNFSGDARLHAGNH